MISPISTVSFKGGVPSLKNLNAMDAIDKTQKTMSAINNVAAGADVFTKDLKTDTDAYSDGITNALTENADKNVVTKKVAEAAQSKAGKKLAKLFGGFTAFCTNLAGTATTITATTSLLGK